MRTINIVIFIIVIVFLLFIGYFAIQPEPPEWTGFGETIIKPDHEPHKTLFDWLELLIIPASFILLGWIYKESEKLKTKKAEEERARNNTLDSFFNIMTELLQNQNLANNPSVQVKAMAKTRINITLNQLDGARKGLVLQFLYESELIDSLPRIKLLGANFNNSILDKIVLVNSEIRGAHFKESSIQNANLNGAIFNSSDLENANLSGSLMKNVDLGYTNLKRCKLKNIDLTSVEFEGADLTNADLRGSSIKQTQLDLILKKEGIKTTKKKII